MLSGRTEITVRGKIYTLTAEQLVFIPKKYFHIYRSLDDTPLKMVTVHFDMPGIEMGASKAIPLRKREVEILKLICADMEESCGTMSENVPVALTATAGKLFAVFLEYVMSNDYTVEPLHSKDTVIFRNAVNFMKTNLGRKLSVREVAAECAVCRTKLTEIFEKHVDMGCMKYFAVLKMERARQLLIAGKSCLEVSKELGFPSQSYLSKRFKLHFGTVPSNINAE